MYQRLNDLYTTVTGILSIEFFKHLSADDVAQVYGFFCQSLVATAAIGKIILEYYEKRKRNNTSR